MQLNLTYMKRILPLVSVKNITFKSSYNWLKSYKIGPAGLYFHTANDIINFNAI